MGMYDFAEELRVSKQDINDIIEKLEMDSSLVKQDFWRYLRPILFLGNPRLETQTRLAFKCLQPKRFFFFKMYPSVEKCCFVLSNLIEQIDAEIDYEEKVGVIASKLSQINVSFFLGETDPELERKIRQNAIAISRIIS